jgi:hypothetical protein
MKMLKADPATGKIDVELVEQTRSKIISRNQLSNKKAGLGLSWNQAGPDNVGGRTRAVLVDQSNENLVYAGSIAGGLFVSTDGSLSWSPVAAMQGLNGENLIISCITQTDNGRVFFGTGSTFDGLFGFGGDGGSEFLGNGVYEYVHSTGAVLPVVTNSTALPNNSEGSTWTATNIIAHKGNRLYVGTQSGMYWADASGANDVNGNPTYPTSISGWTNPIEVITGVAEVNTCQDIDVASDGALLVCFGTKVYTSPTGEVGTFTKTSLSGARISAAIAPSNPNIYYLIQCDNAGNGHLIDMQISQDKGATWSIIIPDGSPCIDPFVQNDCTGGQGKYDMAIAVDPADAGHVIVGGIQLYEFRLTPGSSPVGGSWLKSATLNEFNGNNTRMHADKHTIFWGTTNTVYVGHDGGVSKSTDNGATWQARNFGYNVTTFYDATMAANGYLVGGSQDNGTQLQTFGDIFTGTPLGTTEIFTGDGFDCAFSSFSSGIVYATSQNGNLGRSTPGGSMGTFYNNLLAAGAAAGTEPFHTVIENWENSNDPLSIDSINLIVETSGYLNASEDTIFAGDTLLAGKVINYTSLTNGLELQYTLPAQMVLDSISDTIRLVDSYQNRFVVRTNSGCYLTKDAARFNATQFKWFKISNQSNVENFEFSPNGNSVYLGTSNGKVFRVSGLASVNNDSTQLQWDNNLTESQIGGGLGGGSVVSLAIDPNNCDNLIAGAGSYSTNPHIYRSTNASTATSTTGTFEAIQGVGNTALPYMPVYDVEVDYSSKDTLVIGTEWGVWTTQNAFSALSGAAVEWCDESGTGMAHVPVFAVEQQHLSSWLSTNSGYYYLGTHARGFYYASDLSVVSVEEADENFTSTDKNKFISNLKISPNPLNTRGELTFDLNTTGATTVKIFNLTGSLVKTMNLGMKNKGENKEEINAANLSVGTYILSLEANGVTSVAKFIVTR